MSQLSWNRSSSWAGIDPLVRFFKPLLEHGPEMDTEHMEECIDIACDEHTKKASSYIIRRTLEKKIVHLGELADEVYNKPEDNREYRKKLRLNILYRMRDIGLWKVVEHDNLLGKNKVKYHGGFDITAGPVLLAFHRHIYMPHARRRTTVACKLLKQLEN